MAPRGHGAAQILAPTIQMVPCDNEPLARPVVRRYDRFHTGQGILSLPLWLNQLEEQPTELSDALLVMAEQVGP